jgi:asparagine synthase (glutamine-hydrolysing)
MCGILGVAGSAIPEKVIFKNALNALQHRGPDAQLFCNATANLIVGHTRLSIVDSDNNLSNQPMIDERSGNVLIFNGEIYNYKELRKYINEPDLKTKSDTEVLLKLLTHLGVKKTLPLLNGMWAFSFYDAKADTVTLSRDRTGKKPLFFTKLSNKTVAFSSEAKSLFLLGKKPEINHNAIINFLFERTVGSNDESFFKSIESIPPGTHVNFDPINPKIEKFKRYWDFPHSNSCKLGYLDAVHEFKEIFTSAVTMRFSDEVPFAVLVSGGLDSSSIASVVGENVDREIMAISAIYPGNPLDESKYAEEVINKHPRLKKNFIVIDSSRFSDGLDKTIMHQETPFADGSMVAHRLLMEEIHSAGIRVVLSGNGGDEVLAGYQHNMIPAMMLETWQHPDINNINRSDSLRAMYYLLPDRLKRKIKQYEYSSTGLINNKKVLDGIYPRYSTMSKHESIVNSNLISFITHWSLPGFNWYEDRNAMAHNIEARSPFQDYRIIDFLLSCPGNYKIDYEWTKKILRDSMKGILPDSVRLRKDKQGFHAPIKDWEQMIDYEFIHDLDFLQSFPYLSLNDLQQKDFVYRWRIFVIYRWFKIFFKDSKYSTNA